MSRLFLGLDGCRGGWAAALLTSGASAPQLFMAPSLEAVMDHFKKASRIFLDIPVGLRSRGAEERACDLEARRLLRARPSAVFRVPVRKTVYARTYREAGRIERRLTGKGLSIQSWNICPKIREADMFLRKHQNLASRLFESHPELCFAVLSGGSLLSKKSERQGAAERRRILARHVPGLGRALRSMRGHSPSSVKTDDWLDACVLAVSARLSSKQGMAQVPRIPRRDRCGLLMRIVFADPRRNR